MANAIIKIGDKEVLATDKEIDTLDVLEDCRQGGVATIHAYIPSTNWIVRPVQDIQFLSRVSTMKLYARRKAALESLSYEDVAHFVAEDEKLSILGNEDAREIFSKRKEMEISSIEQTKAGDRSDAHRQGHDRCYAVFAPGVKVHLVTEKGEDGLKHPVLTDGYPSIDSIMLSALVLNVKTLQAGERKKVNSGVPVRMSNCIKRVLNAPGLNLKTFSLKADNFSHLFIDRTVILNEDIFSDIF